MHNVFQKQGQVERVLLDFYTDFFKIKYYKKKKKKNDELLKIPFTLMISLAAGYFLIRIYMDNKDTDYSKLYKRT